MTRERLLMLVLLAGLLMACSSPPDIEYEVTTYKTISHTLMTQADRKRQLEHYDEAIELYREAEVFAQKRNDKMAVGLSRLKRAAIYIEQKQQPKALALMAQVEQMNQYEALDLTHPLMFIQAKFAHASGDTTKAVALLMTLEQAYLEQPQRNIYYRMVRWSYQPDSVALAVIRQDMIVLEKLVEALELDNIEIYSFALFHYAKWLSEQGDSLAEAAITKAIDHFSMLELTPKIRDCYQMGADYYRLVGQGDKAAYFGLQAAGLKR